MDGFDGCAPLHTGPVKTRVVQDANQLALQSRQHHRRRAGALRGRQRRRAPAAAEPHLRLADHQKVANLNTAGVLNLVALDGKTLLSNEPALAPAPIQLANTLGVGGLSTLAGTANQQLIVQAYVPVPTLSPSGAVGIVASGGGNIVASGGNIVGTPPSSTSALLSQDGGSLLSNDGGGLLSNDGGG